MNKFTTISALLLVAVLFGCLQGTAQTKVFEFTYDDSGNRTKREFIQLKSGSIPSDEGLSQEQKIHEDNLSGYDIKIYPNPTKGRVTVHIAGIGDNKAGIYLYNPQGRLIKTTEFTGPENMVDLSGQPPGLYVLRITVEGQNSDWKIIKD